MHFYKINYDTAICPSFSAQDVVCRDSTGSIIQCSIISLPCSAIFGEATVALLAACMALSLKLSFVILKGDSLIVTLALNHTDHARLENFVYYLHYSIYHSPYY